MNNGTYAAMTLGDAMSHQSSGSFDGCTRRDACPDHQQALDQREAKAVEDAARAREEGRAA